MTATDLPDFDATSQRAISARACIEGSSEPEGSDW